MCLSSLLRKSQLIGPQQPRCQSAERDAPLLINVCRAANLVIWFGQRLSVRSVRTTCVILSVSCVSSTVSIEAVCADDLLSVILYLLVKTEIPNW